MYDAKWQITAYCKVSTPVAEIEGLSEVPAIFTVAHRLIISPAMSGLCSSCICPKPMQSLELHVRVHVQQGVE